MDKMLSIIVPSYNMEKYLPKCLGSLIVDDVELFQKLDVIVVNDGSTDCTSEIAHDFERRYPSVVRVIDKSNGHYGSCINAGLKVAAGEYVKILDADDWFDGEALKKFIVGLEQLSRDTHPDLVLTDFLWVDEEGKPFRNTTYGDDTHSWTKVFRDLDKSFLDGILMHGVTYRTQMLREMGYHQTEGVSYTDTQWAGIPLLAVKNGSYFPCTLYRYLVGRAGQSIDPAIAYREGYRSSGKTVLESLRFVLDSKNAAASEQYEYVYDKILHMVAGIYSTALRRFHDDDADSYLRDFDQKLFQCSRVAYDGVIDIARWTPLRFRPIKLWRRNMSSRGILFRLVLFMTDAGHYCRRVLAASMLHKPSDNR